MADVLTKEQRRKNMQAIRSKSTKIETKVAKTLWHSGIRLRKNTMDLFGKPDLSIKKYKIVIFIDSCFWHGCEQHGHVPKSNDEYWNKKFIRNKQRDLEVTEYYTKKKWNILRIWEHELKDEFDASIIKIINFITQSKMK